MVIFYRSSNILLILNQRLVLSIQGVVDYGVSILLQITLSLKEFFGGRGATPLLYYDFLIN